LQIVDFGPYASAVGTFGGNIEAQRKLLGWSQETLAKKMGLKRPSTVQAWEKGRRTPKIGSVRRIAAALGCEPSTLMRDVPDAYSAIRDDDEGLIAEAIELLRAVTLEDRRHLVALLRDPDAAPRAALPASESPRVKPQTKPGTTHRAVRRR
jgi:transcriptional regulator with XRE-family HTH domain